MLFWRSVSHHHRLHGKHSQPHTTSHSDVENARVENASILNAICILYAIYIARSLSPSIPAQCSRCVFIILFWRMSTSAQKRDVLGYTCVYFIIIRYNDRDDGIRSSLYILQRRVCCTLTATQCAACRLCVWLLLAHFECKMRRKSVLWFGALAKASDRENRVYVLFPRIEKVRSKAVLSANKIASNFRFCSKICAALHTYIISCAVCCSTLFA